MAVSGVEAGKSGTMLVVGIYAAAAPLKREAERMAKTYRDVAIETVLSPPWTTDWISEEGRRKLRAYGIAPPELAKAATCPRCGSTNTEEVSRFGSTPCKAQWRCKACLEPFDRFKCH